MSRHSVCTTRNDEDVCVTVGWDRPLSGFFMDVTRTIEFTDEDDGVTYQDDEYIYSNLEDPNLPMGLSLDLNYFKLKISDLNIELPDEIFTIVENDGVKNVGNLFAFYEFSGGSLKLINSVVG